MLPDDKETEAQDVEGAALPFPIVLQRRAREALPAHLKRSAMRLFALAFADLTALALGREAYRAVRDGRMLGDWLGELLTSATPPGTFAMPQVLFAVLLGLALTGSYRAGDNRRSVSKIVIAAVIGVIMVFWHRTWNDPEMSAFVGMAVGVVAFGSVLVAERAIVDAIVRRMRSSPKYRRRAVLVGHANAVSATLADRALRLPADVEVLGFLDTSNEAAAGALGKVKDLVEVLESNRAETVVLCGEVGDAAFASIVETADSAGCEVLAVPRGHQQSGFEPRMRYTGGVPMVELTRPGLRGSQQLLKRIVDIVVSATGLVLTLPLLAVVAVAVKVSSRGPVIFKQIRVGRGGELFYIYKFRSMQSDAEQRQQELFEQSLYTDGRLFKVPNDPRVTPVGSFLRRTSLDELPQLWNVFRGDMSLVGPRPPLPTEVELYEEHHYARFDVKPGITGPWQVSGRNRITVFEEVMRLERAYIRDWTIWKDVQILARTIPAVFRMDGAH